MNMKKEKTSEIKTESKGKKASSSAASPSGRRGRPKKTVLKDSTVLSEFDRYLFHEGTNCESYKKLGAHLKEKDGVSGTEFALWAPNAKSVSVITDRTDWWDEDKGRMTPTKSGIWELFVPGVGAGDHYRFVVVGADGVKRYKSDPYAFYSELRPENASIIFPLEGYDWHDGEYMQSRSAVSPVDKPMAIYEVHLGSWKKDYSAGKDGFLNYRALALQLADYVEYMGYTHVELIGISEYPFDGSWGYQVTGFFSPTSRYGSPDDFRFFVDTLHSRGVGVILDWVPAHFPKDSFGLAQFDGTHLYESDDPLLAEYPEWGTMAFDHGRPEVRSFLISSAFYWIEEFHIDALRVDAVAAMLYTNFSRKEWRPNRYGGNENLDSIAFLKQLNSTIRAKTDAYLIAEDSSTLPGVTNPVEEGGLGFLFKWNMGWMNDTLKYIGKDPIFRKWHHDELTHTADYAFLENFVLVLSHDEVVHLKHPMLEKFPGGLEDQLGGLKSLYTFQFTAPGKKLLFMGQDFAENREWDENREINWALADDFGHRDVMQCVRNLLGIYRKYPCLYDDTRNPVTFEWINRYDSDRNILSYIRRNPWNFDSALVVICNFAPVPIPDYTFGVPVEGMYPRIFSTYDSLPGAGSPGEVGDVPPLVTRKEECDAHPYRLMYSLRPYESVIFEFPDYSKADSPTKAHAKPKRKTSRRKAEKQPSDS